MNLYKINSYKLNPETNLMIQLATCQRQDAVKKIVIKIEKKNETRSLQVPHLRVTTSPQPHTRSTPDWKLQHSSMRGWFEPPNNPLLHAFNPHSIDPLRIARAFSPADHSRLPLLPLQHYYQAYFVYFYYFYHRRNIYRRDKRHLL